MTGLAASLADLAGDIAAGTYEAESADLLRNCLIDAAAAAVAACRTEVFATARRFALARFGPGTSPFWFVPEPGSSALGAVFANATAMSALDIDDGNRAARGHLGAAVIPVATAIGAEIGADERSFARSIQAGCEIGARLGASEHPAFSASGRWAGVGAAATAGLLLDLNASQLANAIAIAAHTAPVMAPAASRVKMTGQVKEGVAFGALSGLIAASLAREGYTGDNDAIESSGLYDLDALRRQGAGGLTFGRTYFKVYSCCRLAHAPIDAALALVREHGIAPDAIRSITVETFRAAIGLPNEARPPSFEAVQYSLPFTIALALLRGASELLPLSPGAIADGRVHDLADRITLDHRPDYDQLYPAGTPARVTIKTKDGRVVAEERDTADGDPSRPFDTARLLGKLRTIAQEHLAPPYLDWMVRRLSGDFPTARAYEAILSPREGLTAARPTQVSPA